MPHDDPKIPGSPANTMRRLKQIRRKVAQLITDAASCNDNSPHFRDCPLDTGADRMFLREIDMAIDNHGNIRKRLDHGNASFSAKQVEDWCHLCGCRAKPLAEAWYPKNAEHGGTKCEYIRICWDCLGVMQETVGGDRQAPAT